MESLLTPEELSLANESKASFERLFGIPMNVRVYDSNCESPEYRSGTNEPILHPEQLLALGGDPCDPFIGSPTGNRYPIACPIANATGIPVFAVGELELSQAEMLGKLVSLAQSNVQLQHQVQVQTAQLEGYADQVLQDFEERRWLEELVALEVSDVDHDGDEVAAKLLGRLRQVIYAEAAMFYRAEHSDTCPDRLPCQFNVSQHASCWIGYHEVDEVVVRQLIADFMPSDVSQPVVQNWSASAPEREGYDGVHSFVLTAISGEDDRCAGWLLAINYSVENTPESITRSLPEKQFGTEEARLLRSAAIGLGTYFHNVRLCRAGEKLAV